MFSDLVSEFQRQGIVTDIISGTDVDTTLFEDITNVLVFQSVREIVSTCICLDEIEEEAFDVEASWS